MEKKPIVRRPSSEGHHQHRSSSNGSGGSSSGRRPGVVGAIKKKEAYELQALKMEEMNKTGRSKSTGAGPATAKQALSFESKVADWKVTPNNMLKQTDATFLATMKFSNALPPLAESLKQC